MDINIIKKDLENIIHDDLYGNADVINNKESKISEISNFLNKSKNILDDIRTLFSTKNNETCFAYDKYLLTFIEKAPISDKMELLNNQEKYEDLTSDSDILIEIWNTLSDEEKIDYLKNKKKFNNNDIKFINNSINTNNILKEILENDDIRKKIEPFTIEIPIDNELVKKIDILDFDLCNIFTKECYTKLLLKCVSNFTEFKDLYEKNNKIYNLILNNSLRFNSNDNEMIHSFIVDNNNFIGKFNEKYLDIFSILEISNMSKNKTLDNDAYSTILQKLYLYNKDKASEYFNLDNLKRCSKHSISINPFDNLNEDIRKNIFNTYTLFNKFIDTIMIEAINNYFDEQDILDILRNDKFINDTSSYAIELLLNKLSFKSAFNMMQRKIIFNKISHLNVDVNEKDAIFVKGYLDSPILLFKSDHNMIFEMLKLLNSKDVLYYLALPYINEKLSSYEIINICLIKKLKLNEIIKIDSLVNNLETTDIINLIDNYWEKNVDLTIFNNKEIANLILNIDSKQFDKINFEEVNYLFETIRMKSLLSKQTSKITISSYKAVLAAYLTLGMDETLQFISTGNMNVNLDEVKELQTMIVDEQILLFKQNNSAIFMNMDRKIVDNLLKIKNLDNINNFAKELKHNTYLDNILYLMLDNKFDNYNNIIDRFYSFTKYYSYNEYQSKKEMYEYTNSFVNCYISNKVNEFNDSFEKIILNNFKPKENILYKKRKELGKEYLKSLKLKILIRALVDNEKELYKNYFESNYDVYDIKNDYIKYLAKNNVDYNSILEHVLIPLSNDRFDKVNCLSKIGIKKPNNFDTYIRYTEDIRRITLLNSEIEKLKSNEYTVDEFILILNHVCYKNKLPFKVKINIKRKLEKLKKIIDEINGQIYIDKSALKFIYNDSVDIYNMDEILEYKKYLEILEKIINKTFSFIILRMNDENIKNYFNKDYTKVIDNFEYSFPITTKYYELRKRVFSLGDIEKIFNGYEISNFKKMNNKLKQLLFEKNNAVMVAEGYYDGIVDNLGIIINKWNNIEKYVKELNINETNLTLISIETILRINNFEDNTIGNNINKKIIKNICDDLYYEELNVDERISTLINLYKKGFSRIKSTIPYITYIDDAYKVEIIDTYNQESLMSFPDSLYKVGAIGNDFLHYSILNKNGFSIIISKNEEIIARCLGVRNGNAIYLNYLEGICDEYYDKLLRDFANKIIEETNDTDEPIQYVMIVNNNIYNSQTALRIDTTMCPIVNYPINEKYSDFEHFKNNNTLFNSDKLYTNYDDGITTLLANSCIVDKNNFKYYDADAKYFRKRNKVIKLSNNIGEEILNKIDAIIDLCREENVKGSEINVSLDMIDTIYLGDDFVLFVTKRENVIKYILPYDTRANNEVNLIINSLSIKEEI